MNGQGIPRQVLLWGAITVGSSIAIMAVTVITVVVLYRTGTWTRDQLSLFGPIVVLAAVVIPNAVSLLVLRHLVKGMSASTGDHGRDKTASGPM